MIWKRASDIKKKKKKKMADEEKGGKKENTTLYNIFSRVIYDRSLMALYGTGLALSF